MTLALPWRLNPSARSSLVLVTRPGIEVVADDVAVRGGSVKVRPDTGSKRPLPLRVEESDKAWGGSIVAGPRGRGGTFWHWLLRKPWPYYGVNHGLMTRGPSRMVASVVRPGHGHGSPIPELDLGGAVTHAHRHDRV
ncbi:MAG TPA: hypothetical protein VLW50_26900 [Streptosporangiaceae bacterium]|nr:hypothetical protein [Streptosporangiaceae bacterium]